MHGTRLFTLVLLLSVWVTTGIGGATETAPFPVPVETIQPPANLSIGVQVDQVGTKIISTFRGGFGQNLLKDLSITVITPDGKKETQKLGWATGDSVTFTGTGCGDQVTGTATYMSGMMYPFLNEMMEIIPDLCNSAPAEVTDPCSGIAASVSMKPDTIEAIPANRSVVIQANVDLQTIHVQFRGGFGQNLIKTLTVTMISPDGAKETQDLEPRVGSTATFRTSNGCMERITADVTFMDGTAYHFYDQVLSTRRST